MDGPTGTPAPGRTLRPSTGASDGHQTGVSARRSDTGVGYLVTLADEVNTTLRIRYWTVWSTTGGAIVSAPASVTPGTNYYGRFYLVGSSLRAKYWAVGAAGPGRGGSGGPPTG